jgi:hypothetical protein
MAVAVAWTEQKVDNLVRTHHLVAEVEGRRLVAESPGLHPYQRGLDQAWGQRRGRNRHRWMCIGASAGG